MREEAKALSPKQCAVIELALDTIKVDIQCHMHVWSQRQCFLNGRLQFEL